MVCRLKSFNPVLNDVILLVERFQETADHEESKKLLVDCGECGLSPFKVKGPHTLVQKLVRFDFLLEKYGDQSTPK